MDGRSRSGFTLMELVVTSSLSLVILSGLLSVFIGSSRFVREILLESELAMRARDLRERLLFQAAPQRIAGGAVAYYGGLLSSRPDGYGGTAKLQKSGSTWIVNVPRMHPHGEGMAPGFGIENLALAIDDRGLYDANHADSDWLLPAGLPFGWKSSEFTDSDHAGAGFIDELQFNASKDAQGNRHANYRLTLRYSLNGVTRVERINVPVAGVQQYSFPDETFHDFSSTQE